MDFEPTERQAYWRDRVRDFIEQHVRPNMDVYKAKCKFSNENVLIKVIKNFTQKTPELKDCVLS